MTHPDWPDVMHVGCVCAGHMQEDYAAARKREAAYKRDHPRREKDAAFKKWVDAFAPVD